MHIFFCFPENELTALILLWDGCYWSMSMVGDGGGREGVGRALGGLVALAGGEGWG